DRPFIRGNFLLEQLLGSHHLDDVVLHLRYLVVHVPDDLLEYQLRIFGLFDDSPKDGPEKPFYSIPHLSSYGLTGSRGLKVRPLFTARRAGRGETFQAKA